MLADIFLQASEDTLWKNVLNTTVYDEAMIKSLRKRDTKVKLFKAIYTQLFLEWNKLALNIARVSVDFILCSVFTFPQTK